MKILFPEKPCLTALLITLFTSLIFSDVHISADDSRINYFGRFSFSDDIARFTWSGAIIEASFSGPKIGITIEGGEYYDIEIDGNNLDPLKISSGTSEYIIAENLSDDSHTIRIIRRSENHYSPDKFKGFIIEDGNDLITPPAKPLHKIEFIGDSYTAGYGIESPGRSCSGTLDQYTNANKSFPSLVTRAFHAQSILLGCSGRGIVRNYGDSEKRSENPFPTIYDKTLGESSDLEWDFNQWVPDLVVVCLGTNDFSTDPNPDDSMYINDYHLFIDSIYNNYPDVSLICFATRTGPCQEYVQRVVNEQNDTYNRNRIFYAEYPSSLELTGCDWHPSVDDNKKVADVLIDTVSKVMQWDTTGTTVAKGFKYEKKTLKKKTLSVFNQTGMITLVINKIILPLNSFEIRSIDGKLVKRISINTSTFSVPLRSFPSGVYVAGNETIGWNHFSVTR